MKPHFKFYSPLFLLLMMTAQLQAQDLIYTQDNQTINAKIEEIGLQNILYKVAGSSEEISMPKSNVHKILYKNGREEIINTKSVVTQREIQTKKEVVVVVAEPKKKEAKPNIAGYVGVNLGLANPKGDLADNNINNTKSQYTLPGFNFNVEAGYFFIKYVGLGLKISSNTYVKDDNLIARNIEKIEYNAGYNAVASTTSEANSMTAILFGIKARLPIKKFSAEMGFWIGGASATLGSITTNESLYSYLGESANDGNYIVTTPSLNSAGSSRGIDLNFKYNISNSFYIGFQAELLFHKTDFENFKRNYYSENLQQSFDGNLETAENFVWRSNNFSIGVGYIFRKK